MESALRISETTQLLALASANTTTVEAIASQWDPYASLAGLKLQECDDDDDGGADDDDDDGGGGGGDDDDDDGC